MREGEEGGGRGGREKEEGFRIQDMREGEGGGIRKSCGWGGNEWAEWGELMRRVGNEWE